MSTNRQMSFYSTTSLPAVINSLITHLTLWWLVENRRVRQGQTWAILPPNATNLGYYFDTYCIYRFIKISWSVYFGPLGGNLVQFVPNLRPLSESGSAGEVNHWHTDKSGMSGLFPNWVILLTQNGTNQGLFKIRFQYILAQTKCTKIWS